MTVRRGAARVVMACAILGGLVVAGAAPARADDDSVRLRAADKFTAGGGAESVAVEVRRRGDGCVLVRTGLRLRLDGVRADQVSVQVNAGGQWWPVPVTGSGVVSTEQTAPANPTLCKGRSITVRYRVAFLAGAPAGRLTVAASATTATGRTIGRDSDAARVIGDRSVAASASATPTPSPSPTPSLEPTEEATSAVESGPTLAAVGAGAGESTDESSPGGGMSMVMVVGVAMVVAGAGLIVLLVRRSRGDRRDPALSFTTAVGVPARPHPGGTTYRSGAGHPGVSAPPGPYGARAPGSPGTSPPPAPSGGGDSTVVMPRLPR